MESILPSQVARLVYGYLATDGYTDTAQQFLDACPLLHECQKIIQDGRRFNTRFHERNLVQILDLFTNIYALVQDEVEKMGQTSRGESWGLLEQLCELLELNSSLSRLSVNSNSKQKNIGLNITVCSQEESSNKAKQGPSFRRTPEAALPETSRKTKKDDNSSGDAVDFVLHNLIDNTGFHEKIADKINKAIATPEKECSVPVTDTIKAIAKETEEDPFIQELISQIITVSAENEVGIAVEETVFKENTEPKKKSSGEEIRTGIKQRLRSSKAKPKRTGTGPTIAQDDSCLSTENGFGNSKYVETNSLNEDNCESTTTTVTMELEKRACLLETAMSNCDITESSKADPSMNFCFVDVNKPSQLSPRNSPSPEISALANKDMLDTSNMVVITNASQTMSAMTSQTTSNSQIVLTPRNQNTRMMTLSSPLFKSGSIFTVIPPVATSTPTATKHFSAVVVSEDTLNVPKNNIFTANDVTMAVPVSTTAVKWDYIPITPKPAVPESDVMIKAKEELIKSISIGRGKSWRKGMKGSTRKTERISRIDLRKIYPKRPPVRTLKNVPRQRLANGVEIEVLNNETLNQASGPSLFRIDECINEDVIIEEENSHVKENENKEKEIAIKPVICQNANDLIPEKSHDRLEVSDEKNCSITKNLVKVIETKTIAEGTNLPDSNVETETIEKATPGPKTTKKLSLSTPRRSSGHVRALDFSTPPKKFLCKKANTSPKRVSFIKRNAVDSVKRSKLFKSPTLSAKNNSVGGKELVFKSPISKDSVPIATLSPAQAPLQGDWDKVNGVQMIIDPEPTDSKSKASSWDQNLRALISGDFEDPLPPKKTYRKKKLSPKKKLVKTIKTRLKKKGKTETQKNKTNKKLSTTDASPCDNETDLGKSKIDESNVKEVQSKTIELDECDVDKSSEQSRNSDNEGLLMVVEEEDIEDTNLLENSISESVFCSRIEENLKSIVGSEEIENKDKCVLNNSSTDVLNILLGNNTEKNERIGLPESHAVVSKVPVETSLEVETDFATPVPLCSDTLNKPSLLPVLETPVKLDFAGLVPKTPYLDTPMLKTIREHTSVLSSDLLLTPSLPPTPFQEGGSNSHSNLSIKTPNKSNVEDVLIKECQRIEGEKLQNTENISVNESKNEDHDNRKKEAAVSVYKSPDKVKNTPRKNNADVKRRSRSRASTSSSKSSGKQKLKVKSSEKLVEKFLKKAKEELFGGDVSSSDNEIFEKKINKKQTTTQSIYSQIYTDDSSDSPKKKSRKNNSVVKNNKKLFLSKLIVDSESDDDEIDYSKPLKYNGLNKKQRTVKKSQAITFNADSDSEHDKTKDKNGSVSDEKIQTKLNNIVKTKSEINKKGSSNNDAGISFSTSELISNSMEKLVENSQSPKRSELTPQKPVNINKPEVYKDLFTPSKSTNQQEQEKCTEKPVAKSSSQKNCNNVNQSADQSLSKRGSNNNAVPKLDPSSGIVSNEEICLEVRHFPISNQTVQEVAGVGNKMDTECVVTTQSSSATKITTLKQSTVFLSKNETFTTIVFDEINFKPKPVTKIDDFDKLQVEIVIDVDEGGKEIYGTISVQPLRTLIDTIPKTALSLPSNMEVKSSKSVLLKQEQIQKPVSSIANRNSIKQPNEKTRDSPRSDKNSSKNSKSLHREIRDKSVDRWRSTPRKVEYTRRSDGKRRIKPTRIDDREYEERLRKRNSRYEERDSSYRSRSSSRYNRDRSRTRREEHIERTHYHSERRRNESDKKYKMQTDQNIEEEDRKEKDEIESKSKEERNLVSYEDNDVEDITEDDLMNLAVMSGSSSLVKSKKQDIRRSSQESENISKKRKASSDEKPADVPVKKAKTDGPQALLQKVDLDHFLSVVHGDNSMTSPPT